MRSFKQFRKQLAFILLIGSAVFSASSSNAQEVVSTIHVNTDVIIERSVLTGLFPTATELALVQIGGVVGINDSEASFGTQNRNLWDTFAKDYFSGTPVGGSTFQVSTGLAEISGLFTEQSNQLLFGIFPSSPNNPPDYNNTQVCNAPPCVAFHYGYDQDITSDTNLSPLLLRSLIHVRDPLNPGITNVTQYTMVSPRLALNNQQRDRISEFLVVFSEQRNPRQPNVTIVNWTEFPVTRNQTPILTFSNGSSRNSVKISNVRVLRSSTEIPLDQLNSITLPPTTRAFQPVPSANVTLSPGKTTLGVNVNSLFDRS